MAAADLPAVAALEMICHAPLPPEGEALFAERLALFPAGCLVASDDSGLGAYLVAHPWRRGAPPTLGERLGTLPERPDCLHLHDIAVAPRARGQRLVGAALARLTDIGRKAALPAITLVSVHGTEALWARHGFRPAPAATEGYGEAVYMVRTA